MTCQYPEGFRWLTSHPKPRVGKLKGDKFDKERSDFEQASRKNLELELCRVNEGEISQGLFS